MKRSLFRSAAVVSILLVSSVGRPAGQETRPHDYPAIAAGVIETTGIARGICTLLGGGDGEFLGHLAAELAVDDAFLVHVVEPRAGAVGVARGIVDRLHGKSVLVERGDPESLPAAENTIDLLLATHLVDASLPSISLAEVLRVLRPRGKALLGRVRDSSPSGEELSRGALDAWLRAAGPMIEASVQETDHGLWALVTKPRPPGEGDWSHLEHAPDNNPVAGDSLIKAPYMTKWLGRPYYIAMPAVTLAAAGRIFLATGHIAHHKREEPWLNTLMARNGYNGTILWTRKLPDGYLVHRSAFVAAGDTFYMIDTDGSGCILLDAETGEERGRVDMAATRGQWKWMALIGGKLVVLIGGERDPSQTTVVRSDRSHWSWGELSKGYYGKRIPWGFGRKIVALDPQQKKVIWKHEEKHAIDSRGMVAGGGRVFYYCPDSHVGSLELESGKSVWTNREQKVRDLIEEAGRGLSSTPGFRTMTFCLYTPDVLVYQAQTRMNVVALSSRDGYMLWSRKKTTNNPNALYVDDSLILGIGKDGSSLLVDPSSGATLGDLGFAKRSCARLTATSDSLFCRGMPEGLQRFDREKKRVFYNGAVRPSCNDGVIAANGLLYMGPWLCDCNLTLMGRVVMCSAGSFRFDHLGTAAERLEAGDAASVVEDLQPDARDWATYRGRSERSCSTAVEVALDVVKIWATTPPDEFLPTPATAAGGLIFVGGDDGKVRAIDAADGVTRWSFFTCGPLLQPPTIAAGRAYVGSGDGFVYCLEARTGRLLWRFRAAPVERRIPVYGRLSSTWPVHSGVLIKDGVAYAAAGIIDYDGTYVYALDAVTGKIRWQNNHSGHLDPELRKGVSAQGFLTAAAGRLWMPGGNVVSPAAYDLTSGEYRGAMPEDGSPRSNRGEEIGVFRDRYVLLGGRLRFSATENVVSPGLFSAHRIGDGNGVGEGVQIQRGKIPPAWDENTVVLVPGPRKVPVWYAADEVEEYLRKGPRRQAKASPVASAVELEGSDTVAVALARNAVITISEKQQPGVLEPRWSVSAFARHDGSLLWQHTLPSPALPGGLTVDRAGRVLVVLENGGVVCYGGSSSFEERIAALIERSAEDAALKEDAVGELTSMLRRIHAARIHELVAPSLARLGVDVYGRARETGSLTGWRLLGPVPWSDDGQDVDAEFVGEPRIDLERSVRVGSRELGWRPVRTIDRHGKVDLAAIYGSLAGVAAYAHAEFELAGERDLVLRIGSNDGFKCWFNGVEVGRFDGGRAYAPDQDSIAVRGRAGVNRLLLKITQLGANWALGVRVTDRAGKPVAFRESPPAAPLRR